MEPRLKSKYVSLWPPPLPDGLIVRYRLLKCLTDYLWKSQISVHDE